jgi:hypothetical protein
MVRRWARLCCALEVQGLDLLSVIVPIRQYYPHQSSPYPWHVTDNTCEVFKFKD